MGDVLEITPIKAEEEAKDEADDNVAGTTLQQEDEEQYSVFSNATRFQLTYLLGFIIILSTLTATIYFPLIPMLSNHFSVSIQAINLTVTVYAICQAISPPLFASLADAYGRRPILLALICLYICASLGLAINRSSYAALVALRALQSIGGSATPSIAYGVVADVAVVSGRGKMLGPMMSTCNGISAIGPVIGGAVALSTSGYKWVFLSLMGISVICLLVVGFLIPETARNVVGNGNKQPHGVWKTWTSFFAPVRRRLKLRTKPEVHMSDGISLQKGQWRIQSAFTSLRIILHPDAAIVLWTVASSYSIYYTFQVAIPVIFEEVYSYNSLEIGLAFLPGLAGMTIGGIIAGKLMDRNYAREARRHNINVSLIKGEILKDFPIEAARYKNCIPFILVEIALVAGYGWVVAAETHPAAPIVMQFFICAVSTLLSHTASALLVDIFPGMPSTAYASGQVMRCGLSAVSAAVIEPLVGAFGRGWYFTGFSVVVGVSCLGCVVGSRWKGMGWRQRRLAASTAG